MNGFVHDAVMYRDTDDLLAQTVPAVREAVQAGHPVMVAMVRERADRLAAALGADAAAVTFADMAELGRNPGRIIPAWRRFVDAAGTRPAFGIGEPVWPGRSDHEIDECMRHERLLNVAFADAAAFTLLCPYDARRLPGNVLAGADGCHGTHASSDVDPFDGRLPPCPAAAEELAFEGGELHGVREFVAAEAEAAGLGRDQLTDLLLAVTEAAGNSVRHGGGGGRVAAWAQDGAFICEISDRGRISDPLAGRRPPDVEQRDGRGLWIVHQLCDLVRVRSGPGGTRVRLHMQPRGVPAPQAA